MSSNPSINVGVNVNTDKAKQQLQGFKQQAKGAGDGLQSAFGGTKVGAMFSKISGGANSATSALGDMGMAVTATTAVIAGLVIGIGLAVAGMFKLASSTAETADNIGKASQRMGVSIEFYQKMSSAAQHAGTSIETMESSMRKMLLKMTQVEQGNVRAIAAFNDIGVAVMDSNGNMRDQEKVFGDTLIALSKMTNATERNALAQELLGRGASQLAPLFNDGEEAVRGFIDANDCAVKVSKEMADSALSYNDSIQTLGETFKKTTNKALTPFMTMMAVFVKNIPVESVENLGESLNFGLTLGLKTATSALIGLNATFGLFELAMDQSVVVSLQTGALIQQGWLSTVSTLDAAMEKLVAGMLGMGASIAGFFGNTEAEEMLNKASEEAEKSAAAALKSGDEKIAQAQEFAKVSMDAAKTTRDANIIATNERRTSMTNYIAGISNVTSKTDELASSTGGVTTEINKATAEFKELATVITGIGSDGFDGSKFFDNILSSYGFVKKRLGSVFTEGLDDWVDPDLLWMDWTSMVAVNFDAGQTAIDNAKKLDWTTDEFGDFTAEGKKYTDTLAKFYRDVQITTASDWKTMVVDKLMSMEDLNADERAAEYIKGVVDLLKAGSISGIGEEAIAAIRVELEKGVKEISDMSGIEIGLITFSSFQDAMTQIQKDGHSARLADIDSYHQEVQNKLDESLANEKLTHQEYVLSSKENDKVARSEETQANADFLLSKFNQISAAYSAFNDMTATFGALRNTQQDEQVKSLTKAKDNELKGLIKGSRKYIKAEAKHNEEINKVKREQFEDNKKASIANLIISGIVNSTLAFAQAVGQLGFPAGPIIGGITSAIITAGTVAAVANTSAQTPGFENGGVVGGFQGATAGPDNVNINARNGEMFLNARQQRTLFNKINNNGTGGHTVNISQGDIIVQGNATQETLDSIRQVNDDFLYEVKDAVNSLHSAGELNFA